MDRLGGKEVYLPFLLFLASEVTVAFLGIVVMIQNFVDCVSCILSFLLTLGIPITFVARSRHFNQCLSSFQDNWELYQVIPSAASKFNTKFSMLFFLHCDLVHVPGVRGVPQLEKPYSPGSAVCLGGNVLVSISR
jgi:hypothetical protein